MNIFEKKTLIKLCREHGIDEALLDDKLTYSENLKALKRLIPQGVHELADLYAKSLLDMEKHTDLADMYGIPYGFRSETPLIMIRVYVRINRRFLRVFQNRIKPFHKHVHEVAKGYFKVEGQPNEVANIIGKIEDLKPRILRICKKYDRNFQYLPGVGWVRRNA